ncbi:MAG: EpsG family protein [Bacteroidales bacterium]
MEVRIVLLLLFVLTMIGLRPLYWIFTDMYSYSSMFNDYVNNPETIKWEEDFIFDKYNRLLALTKSELLFFFTTTLIYIGGIYRFSTRVFGKYRYAALLMAVTSMSFFAYGVNTIRAGMAASLVLVGLSYLDNLKKALPILLIAAGVHTSMLLPIAAIGISYFFPKTKIIMLGWIASIGLSSMLGGWFETYFSSLGFDDDRLADYLLAEQSEELFAYTGFRWDFLLYSSVPVIMGWYVVVKRGISDRFYLIILNSYLIANSFWILVIRANFSDRFAYLSWFLMPFVIIYPLLKFSLWRNQYAKVGIVVLLNFLFTFALFLLR